MKKNQTEFNQIWLNTPIRKNIEADFLVNEAQMVKRLLASYDPDLNNAKVNALTKSLIEYSRENHSSFGLEQFLQEYPLSTLEGAILMSLAEALLRIPDKQTGIQLLREQFAQGHWEEHLESPHSWLVNLSTRSVLLSSKLLGEVQFPNHQAKHQMLPKIFSKFSENTLITAVNQAIATMGKQFVLAENISDALKKSTALTQQGYRFTFDMLGEAAITASESRSYLDKYIQAIERIGSEKLSQQHSVSVKLSALSPRFEVLQFERLKVHLYKSLKQLCLLTKTYNVALVIDAEEAERLEITLSLFEQLLKDPDLKHWEQLGIAIQSYQKRAPAVIEYLFELAKLTHKRIIIRLVKGAYWDYEIKNAQQLGWDDFPVFTDKMNTELCYLHCAELLFRNSEYCFPQFASHNAQTIATIFYLAQKHHCSDYEFQQLFGMGESIYQGLYNWIELHEQVPIPCSVYAPVGKQITLLPYLVRRLIENGANNSFVNQLYNENIDTDDILIDLSQYYAGNQNNKNAQIPTAQQLFKERKNSRGLNLASNQQLKKLSQYCQTYAHDIHRLGATAASSNERLKIINPATETQVGECVLASKSDCISAMDRADKAHLQWKTTPVKERAALLNKVADLLEENEMDLLCLLINEAGKVLSDAHNEIREAVDFCRYYARRGIKLLDKPENLLGYTGEENQLFLEGRGVFLCISPWNFPLAIFTGQISAALICGNCVLAKPASHTPLIAHQVLELFYQAGFSREVLHFIPAKVNTICSSVLKHPSLSGVAFTGSYASAAKINQILARREGAIIPFIAETGGINVMLADSSALSEQLVKDMVISAFASAGQRCSALRVAFIQDEMYSKTITQLKGAMDELIVANPMDFSADMGPLISQQAVVKVIAHMENMHQQGRTIYSAGQQLNKGINFIAPTLIELDNLEQLHEEIFGPVLHIISYKTGDLEQIIRSINDSGFGLTFGIHSRIPSRIKQLSQQINTGNIYINRNMIGAVVGVQPFGGRGLSGTGPKAGGPHYLQRFVQEKTVTYNSTSIGGNLSLLNK